MDGGRQAGGRRRGRTVLALGAAVAAGLAAAGAAPYGSAAPGSVVGFVRLAGASGADSLGGTVRLEGPAPAERTIRMDADPYCARWHGGEPVVERPALVGEEGGVADVLIYVTNAPPGPAGPAPARPALMDQEGCIYRPHVLAVRAGQPVAFRNSDETLHNVHVRAERNRGFNVGQPRKGLETTRSFPVPEVGVDVQCDIHGWMQAWIGVFDHPFHAVTGPDGGFVLDGLPPGDYEVEAWHATLGTLAGRVTVRAGEPAAIALTFAGGGGA